MARHGGHDVSQATVLRTLRDDGLLLPAEYQKQRRELPKDRKAAFAKTSTGTYPERQLDISELHTTKGGIWRIAGWARLLLQIRVPVPQLTDGDPARCDRGGGTRVGGV